MTEENIMKTGTTTVGMVCKDGIVLCADKKVTAGYLIAHKKFEKVIKINDYIALTVAGSVSDVQQLVKLIRAELKIKDVRTRRSSTVKEAANLLSMFVYGNIRKLSMIPGIAHFIIAGKDDYGFHMYDISPDGSIVSIDDFVSSGSGSVMAYGVLETLYKKDMSIDDAVRIGVKAINAVIQRDIASGNGIDIVTVTKEGIKNIMSKTIDVKIEA